jgi:hypothetical protein
VRDQHGAPPCFPPHLHWNAPRAGSWHACDACNPQPRARQAHIQAPAVRRRRKAHGLMRLALPMRLALQPCCLPAPCSTGPIYAVLADERRACHATRRQRPCLLLATATPHHPFPRRACFAHAGAACKHTRAAGSKQTRRGVSLAGCCLTFGASIMLRAGRTQVLGSTSCTIRTRA